MSKTYLSGKLQGCTPTEALGWRAEATKLLGAAHVIDPARDWSEKVNAYTGFSSAQRRYLVERDKVDIDRSAALLLNAWSPGWGSGCELMYAYGRGLPIAVVAWGDISPWLEYHADFLTDSLAGACRWLTTKLNLEAPCRTSPHP